MNTPIGKRPLRSHPLFYVSIALAAIVVVLSIVLYTTKDKTNIALSVNGEIITKDELLNEMIRQSGPGVMDDLIVQLLIGQEAEAKGIILTDEDVEAEISRAIQNLGGDDAFQQALTMSGMDKDSFRKATRTRLLIERILGPDVKITDAEMRDYFEKHKDELGKPAEVHARHILVDSEEKARDIKARLDGGADFAELAQKESTDTGSAPNGGDLGLFARGRMVPEFEEAAFALEVGAVSDPVKTKFGYHVIRVEERKEAVVAEYDKVQEEVRKKIMREALQEKFPDWLNALKSAAKIRNYVLDRTTLPEAPGEGGGAPAPGNDGATPPAPKDNG